MVLIATVLTCLMIAVIITDFTQFIIPNWLVGIMLLLYPVVVFCAPIRPDWKIALLIGLITFAVGFILFALKAMGGGDVKLLAAAALYAGKASILEFIFGVAIVGGALSLILIVVRLIVPYIVMKMKKPASSIPRVFTVNEPLPYGIAIALAFLDLLWTGKIPGITL